ncbi:telomerase Cajal body protein 1 homolog [Drosophila madeirensis]|uniref:WD repeat-containing protein 79 n=1 Tax=Drosophila madeirensis TaxID=30013 RepID=A0AAU9FCI9_DROMD
MDDSAANLSTSMCDVEEQDLSSALLNKNVSFSSTMVTSSADLSFSLSEAEICKLKQNFDANCRPSEDMELSIPEKNSSVQEKTTLEEQATLDEETTLDEASTLEESESVINLEDTIDDVAQHATAPQIPQSLVVNQPVGADEDESVLAEEAMEIVEEPAAVEVAPPEYFKGKLIEVGRRCWKSSADAQHYTKGCYWSPDGTCLLVPIHLDGMHVMELPPDLYTATAVAQERSLTSLVPAVHVPEGGTVYDCVWYPHMNSQQPDTCFWLATRQHEPIHMWDAFDGKLRCSYSGYDAVDEVMAAISLAFSHDGQKVYAGYKRCIKIFDTSRPGRLCDDYPVKFAISCIAQTTEQPNTLTCGNWHGYIQHFDLRCSPKQGPLFTLGGHKAGITQLKYADGAAGWQLFSGARKCPKLLQWDMRNYKKPLAEYQRHVDTNQRIQFDLTPDLGWLASGDTQGALNVWDMNDDGEVSALPLHNDCCNGVSFHPTLPILASSSGQFHFIGNDGRKNDSVLDCTGAAEPELSREQPLEVIYENAVVMWWCG